MTQNVITRVPLLDYQYKNKKFYIVARENSEKIASIYGGPNEDNSINRAAEFTALFIVRACNYHYELLNALEKQVQYLNQGAENTSCILELLRKAKGL